MQQKVVLGIGAVALVALAVACGSDKKPVSPASPSVSAASGEGAAADGVTLKANPPTLTSPVGGVRLTTQQVTLTYQAATAKYVSGQSFTYRVQLLNAGSQVIEEKTGTGLSYTMSTQFEPDTLYRWRVRAELAGAAGPWSATETFKSMEKPTGYIRGNEIYDPLDDGKTVGRINGPVTWIPGVGVRLDSNVSWIEYELPQTLTAGEYSALISNLNTDAPEVKTKVMAMREDGADITTNEYRFTIEKRGNGVVAWRVIAYPVQVDTVGAQRKKLAFHENLTYFWKATWGSGVGARFDLQIREGGVDGEEIYNFGKEIKDNGVWGVYQPSPHMIFAGCPRSARSGPQTAPGMVISQIWVSPNPRPSWAR